MVTNRYVASRACREEFIQFRTKTQAAGYNGLLTLLVDAPNWDRMDLRTDPTTQLIRDTISRYQWLEPGTSALPGMPRNNSPRRSAKGNRAP